MTEEKTGHLAAKPSRDREVERTLGQITAEVFFQTGTSRRRYASVTRTHGQDKTKTEEKQFEEAWALAFADGSTRNTGSACSWTVQNQFRQGPVVGQGKTAKITKTEAN